MKKRERKPIKRSDNCWIIPITVNFNIKDPDQKWTLDQVDNIPNFSGLVKRLLSEHFRGSMTIKTAPGSNVSILVPATPVLESEPFDPLSAFFGSQA